MAASAQAGDISVNGFFAQNVELRDSKDEDDGILRSTTDFGVTISGETPRGTFSLSPGVSLRLTGERLGEAEVLPLLDAFAVRRAPRRETTATLSVTPRFLDEDDFTASDGDGDVIEVLIRGRLGQTYQATPRDSFSVGLFGQAREFTDSGTSRDASQSFGVDGGWTRQQTPLTSFSLLPRAAAFFSDSSTTQDSQSISLRGGVETALTPTTRVTANLGPSLTFRDNEDVEPGIVGEFDLTRTGPDTRFSFGLSQTIDQDADGDTTNRTAARAGLSWRVNERERLSADASVGLETPVFGDDDDDDVIFNVTPRYTLNVTEDWALAVGYIFRAEQNNGADFDVSNRFFFRISRALSFLP